ncbi:hypothetical protein KFK09_024944 [Dendrobium nobile]|uniref:Uncharacterized protein n=1 Tax=Dendrobium nobile TaxID=94219 RepID=A0A8T3AFH2_DENNO|nr:hypothetical protein KFK09_024944 [Dendrobium nobile]
MWSLCGVLFFVCELVANADLLALLPIMIIIDLYVALVVFCTFSVDLLPFIFRHMRLVHSTLFLFFIFYFFFCCFFVSFSVDCFPFFCKVLLPIQITNVCNSFLGDGSWHL